MICRIVLALAAAYNFAFAVWVFVWPTAVFELFKMPPPWPEFVSRMLAVSIGFFTLVYVFAIVRPRYTRPVIVLGLLSKIAPPMAWVLAVTFGGWPLRSGVLILCDDVIWWLPFVYCYCAQPPPNLK